MSRRKALPHCDEVFARFFAPWYEPDDLTRRPFRGPRPDIETAAPPDTAAEALCRLTAEGEAEVAARLAGMLDAVRGDWPSYLPVSGAVSLGWIDAFDRYWTRARVRPLLDRADPASYSNELLVVACEMGVALGHVMRQAAPQLAWLHDWPYWESALLDVPSGNRINVFDWAIKKFSGYGVDDGYAAKVTACLGLIRDGWDA